MEANKQVCRHVPQCSNFTQNYDISNQSKQVRFQFHKAKVKQSKRKRKSKATERSNAKQSKSRGNGNSNVKRNGRPLLLMLLPWRQIHSFLYCDYYCYTIVAIASVVDYYSCLLRLLASIYCQQPTLLALLRYPDSSHRQLLLVSLGVAKCLSSQRHTFQKFGAAHA